MEYSEIGPVGVCMLTASPLKHGMTAVGLVSENTASEEEDQIEMVVREKINRSLVGK